MGAVHRRRRDRPGGSSWQEAQSNAPGGFIPRHKRGRDRFSPETLAILRWMVGRGPVTAAEVHRGAFPKAALLWTSGCTSNRLGLLAVKGWVQRLSGASFCW